MGLRNTKPTEDELFQIDLDIIDINRGATIVYNTIEVQTDEIIIESEKLVFAEIIKPETIDEMEQICPQMQDRLEGSDEPIPTFEHIGITADIPDPSIEKLARKEEQILELLQKHELQLESQEQKLKDTIQEYEKRINALQQEHKEKINELNRTISNKGETIQSLSNEIVILNRTVNEQKLIESRLNIQCDVVQKNCKCLVRMISYFYKWKHYKSQRFILEKKMSGL